MNRIDTGCEKKTPSTMADDASETSLVLRSEGIRALTLTQAEQLIQHNNNRIAFLVEQNRHLQVGLWGVVAPPGGRWCAGTVRHAYP